MKKIVIILAFIITGCSDDCTEIYDVYKKIESRSNDNALIVSDDLCVPSLVNYGTIRINGNAVLTVTNEDVNVQASVVITGGGTLNVEKSLIVNNNIFFLGNGGVVNVGRGIVVGHAVDQGGFGGEINSCTFASIQILDPGVSSNQTCDIEFEQCETLSDLSVEGYTYINTIEDKCGMEGYNDNYLYKINTTSNR